MHCCLSINPATEPPNSVTSLLSCDEQCESVSAKWIYRMLRGCVTRYRSSPKSLFGSSPCSAPGTNRRFPKPQDLDSTQGKILDVVLGSTSPRAYIQVYIDFQVGERIRG